MPQVSVIMPVYNAEAYLARAVDSVLAQTLRDLELILVDDGSTDSSPALCDAYAARDDRVRVIHQKNGGAPAARNAGIAAASGDYIGFMDSDDYILPAMYERLHLNAVLTGRDAVKCGFFIIEEADLPDPYPLSEEDVPARVPKHYYAAQEIPAWDIARYTALDLLDTGVWNMLIRTDICRRTPFHLIRYDDGYYNLDLSRAVKSLLLLPETYYLYIQRPGSLLRTGNKAADSLALAHFESELFAQLREAGMDDCLSTVYNRGARMLSNYRLLAGAKTPDAETERRLTATTLFYESQAAYLNTDNAAFRDQEPLGALKRVDDPPLPLAKAQYSLEYLPAGAGRPAVSKPRVIRVDPCDKCNFSCYFCPCNKSEAHLAVRHKVMPFALFCRIIDGMSAFSTIDHLELYGYGEPLLNPALPEMIAYARQKAVARRIGFTTNGFLLGPELNQKLVDSGVDEIRVSINGLSAEQYESACGIRLDFTEYLRNIADLRLRARGRPRLTAKIVDAALPARDGEAVFRRIFQLLTDVQIIERVEPIWGGFSFQRVNNPCVGAIAYCAGAEDVCSFPFREMMVFANGDVGLCCGDWRHATRYGDVHASTLPELWASEDLACIRLRHLTKNRDDIPPCRGCRRNGGRYVPAAE
ncbi:MAG: glycosyltransferase [Gracilibacteraceae bacterium]|jgi:glycosyltransferase involved in cell wall biosynthesis/uncharacterized Fe-S cluster-containing radical SAM superfamily protein|nr:glycosyltransferase [Gracilibacteraceae bacterium]